MAKHLLNWLSIADKEKTVKYKLRLCRTADLGSER